ncbi:MAG: DUF3370 family protein [Oscillatoria sp. SIO1A7]|nr:DUF3370 family protein [Oscillatoria sp. SIO1A7]
MFSDIDNHWAKECILQLKQRNLVSGYPDGTFRPNKTVTRTEFAILMNNSFPDAKVVREAVSFKDVSKRYWGYNAIKMASERGFFAGYPDGTFQPQRQIPRVQAIIVLAAQLKLAPPANVEQTLDNFFDDAMQIPNYAKAMVAAATVGGLVVNYPDVKSLAPNNSTTRGDVAAFLCSALGIPGVPNQYTAGFQEPKMEVRPLPGQLDTIPTFNSNSPEIIGTEGILVSTFPPEGKKTPQAHLNLPLKGRFDFFSHHIVRARTQAETRPFYQGAIVHNPTRETVTVEVLHASTYLTSPDALFIDLPAMVDNATGDTYAGPGSRTMNEILRRRRQRIFPRYLDIPPGESKMLMNLPIPLGDVVPVSNGRSTMMRLSSNGLVYVANLAMRAPLNGDSTYRAPTLEEWEDLLLTGKLAEPRDAVPTPLEPVVQLPITFGRVAGVSGGAQWEAKITDDRNAEYLSIPEPGRAFSYVIGTIHKVTLGTGQVQSAPMLARYEDTAYFAHANYGVEYNLSLPLANNTGDTQKVTVTFSSPLKNEEADEPGQELAFLQESDRVFFRGTVRVRYEDPRGALQTDYFHLVQKRGQEGEPLVTLEIPAGFSRLVEVDFLYPPDSTPPQVLTVRTLEALSN